MGSSPCVCVSVYKFPSFYKNTRHTSFMAQSNQVWSQLNLIISPCCSVAKSCPTLCNPRHTRLLCLPLVLGVCSNSCPSNQWCNLKFCYPPLLLPSISSSIRDFFSNKLALHIKQPKYWSFTLSINPSNEYSGFISFGIDWFDRLSVQGTLKSLLQHHSLKAPVLWHLAFFMVQVSYIGNDYWKNHDFDFTNLCRQSDVSAF